MRVRRDGYEQDEKNDRGNREKRHVFGGLTIELSGSSNREAIGLSA